MKINSENIFLFLKMSIFQFFAKSGFNFSNRNREIIFNLLTNDKKVSVQNGIAISETNNVFITTIINIKKEFISIQELVIISNYMNEFFGGIFSCFIHDNEQENSLLLFIKAQIYLNNYTLIDNDFWKRQISIHMNNISSISDALFFEYPKSKFFKNKEITSVEFKNFLFNSIENYFKALNILQEQENEDNKEIKAYIKYLDWTKEKIEKEIDKELSNFSKEENLDKLNMLVDVLQIKEKR